VIAPVVGEMARPVGRPEADHDAMVAVGDESPAESERAEIAVPDTLDWALCPETVTVFVTAHVNEAEADNACESVAVTVTEDVPAVVGVPVTAPLVGLIDRPEGRPVDEKVTPFPPVVSCGAEMVRVGIDDPDTDERLPGLVTDRLSTFQVRLIDPGVPVVEVPPPDPPPV
jgi:hypothetical protein